MGAPSAFDLSAAPAGRPAPKLADHCTNGYRTRPSCCGHVGRLGIPSAGFCPSNQQVRDLLTWSRDRDPNDRRVALTNPCPWPAMFGFLLSPLGLYLAPRASAQPLAIIEAGPPPYPRSGVRLRPDRRGRLRVLGRGRGPSRRGRRLWSPLTDGSDGWRVQVGSMIWATNLAERIARNLRSSAGQN
jgi:hypothetical protein